MNIIQEKNRTQFFTFLYNNNVKPRYKYYEKKIKNVFTIKTFFVPW